MAVSVAGSSSRAVIDSTIFGLAQGGKVWDPSVEGRVLDMFGAEHAERLRRYREYWRMYLGKQWSYERSKDEPVVTVNWCGRLTNVGVNFLVKNGFDVTIPDDPETGVSEPRDRAFVKHALDRAWAANRKMVFAIEMAQMGGVTGDCFLRVSWDESDPLEEPHPRMDVVSSQLVFPEFSALDRKRLVKVTHVWLASEEKELGPLSRFGARLGARLVKARKTTVMWAESWTRESVTTTRDDVVVSEEENVLGEVPFVHIPNYPVAGESYGVSDVDAVMDLNREYNEKATDIGDVINYYGSPVTVLEGAKLRNLERGTNRLWSIPQGAKITNLELRGDLAASNRYLEMLKELFHVMSGIPPQALGETLKIAGVAGSTLALVLQPLLDVRSVKESMYGDGLRLVNRLILRMLDLKDPVFHAKFEALSGRSRYRTEVVFPSPLPRDEAQQLDNSAKRLEAGLSTRVRELRRMGHGESDASQIVKEADAERLRMMDLGFELFDVPTQDPARRSGNPDPERSNVDLRGEKVSRAAEMRV